MPEHMPSYLRIDKDIREGLFKLSKTVKEYSAFDVIQLDREMTRKLELELDRHGAEFKGHRKGISSKLEEAVKLLEESILLKDQIISIRLEKQKDTVETYELCKSFKQREASDSVKLEKQRQIILELNSELRRAYNITSAAVIDGARLSAIEKAEFELQEERHKAVLMILELALADVNHHLTLLKLHG